MSDRAFNRVTNAEVMGSFLVVSFFGIGETGVVPSYRRKGGTLRRFNLMYNSKAFTHRQKLKHIFHLVFTFCEISVVMVFLGFNIFH